MFLDLSDPIDRTKLVSRLQIDVDQSCRTNFKENPRNHLGASVIGEDCAAKGWNTFRWLRQEPFSGQQLRLFNRGHEEEARFVRWLTWAGWQVKEFDPVTKKQFRIVGSKGHFGGSLDGLCKPPVAYNVDPDLVLLIEFKTHNENSFTKLKKEKVMRSKPMHYKQMCSYGRAYALKYALYCAVNKNTDELYFEIVVLDWLQADDLFRRAESIIFTQKQPQKIAQVASYTDCKYCDFAGICHFGQAPEKNCRSCSNAYPTDNGTWTCQVHQAIIPPEVILTGCDSYNRII